MKINYYCTSCRWRWQDDSETVFCCPQCGEKLIYPAKEMTMEL